MLKQQEQIKVRPLTGETVLVLSHVPPLASQGGVRQLIEQWK